MDFLSFYFLQEFFFSEFITYIAGNGNFDDGAPCLSGVDVDHLVVDPSRLVYQHIMTKVLNFH